jgi:hypothetical protein
MAGDILIAYTKPWPISLEKLAGFAQTRPAFGAVFMRMANDRAAPSARRGPVRR